jgi:hypothetical protein
LPAALPVPESIMKFKPLVLVAASLFAANAMACYTVYDRSGRIVYHAEDPPVDMSQQLHSALQRRFPGSHMVFDQGAICEPVSLGSVARATGPAAPPNSAVMGNKVAVATPVTVYEQPAVASFSPADTRVMGAGPAVPRAPVARQTSIVPTRVPAQGASPLLTDKRTADSLRLPYTPLTGNIVVVPPHAVSRVSTAAPRSQTVITELHNPPLTIVQSGGETMINQR